MSDSSAQRNIVPSVPNLRDMGGPVTQENKRVQTGLLYRSEHVSQVNEEDMPAFQKLGLKKIYDLRTVDERAAQPDRVPAGVQYVVEDVLADAKGAAPAQLLQLLGDPAKANATLGNGAVAQMFVKGYVDIVSLPSARRSYAHMFTELADPATLPALFHCTTGKDRTGWAAAALLTLCGVSHEDVVQDYLRSNDNILPEYQPIIDKYVASGVEEDLLLSILGVRQEYLEASFQEMRDQFGAIEEYFALGSDIGAAGQAALCARFLEQRRF